MSRGRKWRWLAPTIAFRSPNTITHLCDKHNIMLFFTDPGCRRFGAGPRGINRAHLGAQTFDEMFDMQRERCTAFYRYVGIEPRRLGNPKQFDAGIAAMGDGELIDHRNSKAGLDQRADGGAEARLD